MNEIWWHWMENEFSASIIDCMLGNDDEYDVRRSTHKKNTHAHAASNLIFLAENDRKKAWKGECIIRIHCICNVQYHGIFQAFIYATYAMRCVMRCNEHIIKENSVYTNHFAATSEQTHLRASQCGTTATSVHQPEATDYVIEYSDYLPLKCH